MMRFGIFDEDGKPVRSNIFDRATRFEIIQKFESAWIKANPGDRGGMGWVTAFDFITGLESYADHEYLTDGRNEKESSQRRREKLTAVANAFEALSIAASKVNEHDLVKALEAGFIAALPARPPHPYYHQAIQSGACRQAAWDMAWRKLKPLTDGRPTELKRFADGMRRHISTMKIENTSWSPTFNIALAIVRFLDTCSIPATTSSTGLAGFSFEATFELAGLPAPKAGYWIPKAKKALDEEKSGSQISTQKMADKDQRYLASLTPWDRAVVLADRQAMASWLDDELKRIDGQLKKPLGLPPK